MPIFANDMGAGGAGLAYGALLFANGAGGLIGGVVLEATGWLKPSVKATVGSTLLYGMSTVVFAVVGNYPLALAMLVIGGAANLAATSMGQTIVQLQAPAGQRGQVIGLYGVSASGLRIGSGFTVGLLGAVIGIHASLGASAFALCIGTVLAGFYALGRRRRIEQASPPASIR
jgi:MFS family permease